MRATGTFVDDVTAPRVVPLAALSLLPIIGSGLWLATLGDWAAIGWGAALYLGASFAIPWVLKAGLTGIGFLVRLLERNWIAAGSLFLLLGSLYTIVVMVAWCVGAFSFFETGATRETFVPLLVWSYGVATGAWTKLPWKGDGDAALSSAGLAQVSCLVAVIAAASF